MSEKRKILILDDDREHLNALSSYLDYLGYEALAAADIDEAIAYLGQYPKFAIVDLFLAGDYGEELSNHFIKEYLVSAGIRYGRMTSAPKLVPKEYEGEWVCDKRSFWRDPEVLRPLLLASLG